MCRLGALREWQLVLDDERRGRVVGQDLVVGREVLDLVGARRRGRPRRRDDDVVDLDDDASLLCRHAGGTALEAVLGRAGRGGRGDLALAAVDLREVGEALVVAAAVLPLEVEAHLAGVDRAEHRVDHEVAGLLLGDDLEGRGLTVGAVGQDAHHADLHVVVGRRVERLVVLDRAGDVDGPLVGADACGLLVAGRPGACGPCDGDESSGGDGGDGDYCERTHQRLPSRQATAKGVWALLVDTDHVDFLPSGSAEARGTIPQLENCTQRTFVDTLGAVLIICKLQT